MRLGDGCGAQRPLLNARENRAPGLPVCLFDGECTVSMGMDWTSVRSLVSSLQYASGMRSERVGDELPKLDVGWAQLLEDGAQLLGGQALCDVVAREDLDDLAKPSPARPAILRSSAILFLRARAAYSEVRPAPLPTWR